MQEVQSAPQDTVSLPDPSVKYCGDYDSECCAHDGTLAQERVEFVMLHLASWRNSAVSNASSCTHAAPLRDTCMRPWIGWTRCLELQPRPLLMHCDRASLGQFVCKQPTFCRDRDGCLSPSTGPQLRHPLYSLSYGLLSHEDTWPCSPVACDQSRNH